MANLETLELTINGSAEHAQQGINNLITSLGNLSDAIVKPYSDLRDLCAVLKEIAGYCKSIKLPSIGKLTGASGAAARMRKAVSDYDPEHNNGRGYVVPPQSAESIAKDQEWYSKFHANASADYQKLKDYHDWASGRRQEIKEMATAQEAYNKSYQNALNEAAAAERKAMDVRGEDTRAIMEQSTKADLLRLKQDALKEETISMAREGKLSAKELAERSMQYQKLGEQIQQLSNQTSESGKKIGVDVSKIGSSIKKAFSGITSLFSKIKRIATTMLIRSAIRGLIKSIKEGVTNVREWAKINNHEFYDSMNNLKKTTNQLKNSLGASLAPLISALIPLMQSLCNIIMDVANAFNQFIALMTGKSSWIKATENVDGYTDSVNKAGGAAKEWLATFDELNVMSNSGGGGSGSSGTNYSDMFEEVTEFDSKIREIVTFIKDNMESVYDMAVAAGVAIVSWKFGKTFMSALPTLSTLMGYIGTIATIAITLQADWLLTNEYLDTGEEGWLISSVLTTAIGGVAAKVIATKLIGGTAGTYAFGFTLLFAALADIKANVEHTDVEAFSKESMLTNIKAALMGGTGIGFIAYAAGATLVGALTAAGGGALFLFGLAIALKLETQKNHISWGNLDLTEEQIDEYVQETMFNPSVKVLIDQYNVIITNRGTLEDSIRTKLGQIQTEYNILKLGIDKETSLSNIAKIIGGDDGTGGLIKDITDMCDINIQQMRLTFGNITLYDGEGNEITSDVLLSGMEGWSKIKQEIEADGKELTQLLLQSAKGELDPQMEEYTQALLEKVLHTATVITQAAEFGEATAKFKTAALAAMSKNSLQGILDAFAEYSSSNEQTIRTALTQEIATWYQLSELETDPELKAKYKSIADALSAGFEQTVAEELKKQNAEGTDLIKEWLLQNVSITNLSGVDYWVSVLEEQGFTAANLSLAINQLMLNNGVDQTVIKAMNLVGFSGWDLLSDELKKKFLSTVTYSFEEIKQLAIVGVSIQDIIKFSGYHEMQQAEQKQMISSILNAYGDSSIAEIKKLLPGINVKDIIKLTNWSTMTQEQKEKFVKAIEDAYGSDAAKEAAKEAGIEINQTVMEFMGINPPQVKPQMDGKATDKTKKDINTRIGTVNAPVEAKETVKKTTEAKTSVGKNLGTFKPAVIATEDTKKTAATRGSVSKNLGSFRQSVVPVESEKSTEYTRGQVSKHLGSFRQNVIAVENKKSTEYTKGAINKNIGTFKPAVKTVENVSATKATRKSTNTNLGTFEPYVKAKESVAATKAARKSVNTNIGTFTPSVVAKESVKSTEYTKGQIKKNIGTFTPGVVAKEDTKITAAVKSSITKGIGTFSPTVNANENKSKTSNTRNSIESGIGTINAYIEAKEKAGKAKTVKDSISDTVGTVNSYVYPYKNVDQSNKTKNLLNDQYKTINAYVYTNKDDSSANQAKASIQATFKGMTASVSVSATLSNSTAFRNSVKGSLTGIRLSVKDGNGTTKQFATIAAAQNGGLFDSGDLFFANEDGTAEMIGRFGNQTGVANQREIVAGIQKGVADANAEQNALLQKQNELLYGILQKCGVQFGASASLGRVVNQSLEMYSALVGG